MIKATAVKALPNYRIWIKFSDDVEGSVDLSHLVGKGVFLSWKDKGQFEKVRIDPTSGAIAWGEGVDLCPDSLYMDITGKKVEEIFPILNRQRRLHA